MAEITEGGHSLKKERNPIINLEMPNDVRDFVLKQQLELRLKRGCMYSQQSTIFMIIKEYEKILKSRSLFLK